MSSQTQTAELSGSMSPVDYLEHAAILFSEAVRYLDRACLDPDICDRINAVEHADELEIIRDKLADIALAVEEA